MKPVLFILGAILMLFGVRYLIDYAYDNYGKRYVTAKDGNDN